MKYFVTGATGFVGGALVRKLREQGHDVQACVRTLVKAKDLPAAGVKLFVGDVTDRESMRAAMQGVDGVFHLAGWYKIGVQDKRDAESVNTQGTHNVLELMQELSIPKGVYTSTLAVNSDTHGKVVDESYYFGGKHLSEYDRTKAAAHAVAKSFIAEGLPLVIVLPGLVYGPGDTSALRDNLISFLNGRLPTIPDQTAYCWAHVDDIAQGHVSAMEKGRIGESYIIAGERQTFVEAFKLASQITGKPEPKTISHRIFQVMSRLVQPFDRVLPPTYTSEGLRIIAGVTYWGDNSKARRELGYDPRPFRGGWEDTLRYETGLLGI